MVSLGNQGQGVSGRQNQPVHLRRRVEGPSAGTERERRVRKGKELPFDSTGNHWQSLAGADVVCPPLHQIMSLWLDPVLAGPSICSET